MIKRELEFNTCAFPSADLKPRPHLNVFEMAQAPPFPSAVTQTLCMAIKVQLGLLPCAVNVHHLN